MPAPASNVTEKAQGHLERYLRVKAVAERFDLAEGSVRNLILLGGAIRVPESAIAELLERGAKVDEA
jgi:hypothetical protein